MSQLDISSFLRSGNAKKIALLEQRINKSTSQSPQVKKELKSGLFPGVQSFFHDFLVIGSCARLHANLLDVLFESTKLIFDQVKTINHESTDIRQIILEGQVLSLITKFTGFVYFYPYASNTTLRQLSQGSILIDLSPFETFQIFEKKILTL